MLPSFRKIYREFPQKFWIVAGVSFIDRIGATLLFPFLSLYITQRFNMGMTEAGVVLGLFSVFGLFGSMIGGALWIVSTIGFFALHLKLGREKRFTAVQVERDQGAE